ncbi:hypothetical protein K8R47_03775 [archaeon]|nr:hypothetical protein [archaeon]
MKQTQDINFEERLEDYLRERNHYIKSQDDEFPSEGGIFYTGARETIDYPLQVKVRMFGWEGEKYMNQEYRYLTPDEAKKIIVSKIQESPQIQNTSAHVNNEEFYYATDEFRAYLRDPNINLEEKNKIVNRLEKILEEKNKKIGENLAVQVSAFLM